MNGGIWDRPIADTPLAVLDFETTGGWPGPDRVVEIGVVRIDPGEAPRLVLDTLVRPDRAMGCTWVHGITDDDVADAPRFADVAGQLLDALEGCVMAAYNVYFDLGFLSMELCRVGVRAVPPHLCLMYLRPLLGMGRRCSLGRACVMHGIANHRAHSAAADALAAARLWERYRTAFNGQRLTSFRDLAGVRSYKFMQSFANTPVGPPLGDGLNRGPLKPRQGPVLPAFVLGEPRAQARG
jgi:DNA polymerase III subunit epsilon